MHIFLFIIIGLAGGVFGGLGMGGGTLLIPLLVWFTGLNQHTAQAVNLIAFIPMSVAVLIIHIKNGLIKFKYLWLISLPAALSAVIASLAAKNLSAAALGRGFGIFLTVLGVLQLISAVIKLFKQKKEKMRKISPSPNKK
ncbi:MAG: sulfite exporter TauE/SafE family protein [Firmicutes bacterium]|nr:sulfite exporter TauE/SafE family protein [Bacillota bacterium]